MHQNAYASSTLRITAVVAVLACLISCGNEVTQPELKAASRLASEYCDDPSQPGCEEPAPGDGGGPSYSGTADSLADALATIDYAGGLGNAYEDPGVAADWARGWSKVWWAPGSLVPWYSDGIFMTGGTIILSGGGRAWTESYVYSYDGHSLPKDRYLQREGDMHAIWEPIWIVGDCATKGMDAQVDSHHEVKFRTWASKGDTHSHKSCAPGAGVSSRSGGGLAFDSYQSDGICWYESMEVSRDYGATWRWESVRVCWNG